MLTSRSSLTQCVAELAIGNADQMSSFEIARGHNEISIHPRVRDLPVLELPGSQSFSAATKHQPAAGASQRMNVPLRRGNESGLRFVTSAIAHSGLWDGRERVNYYFSMTCPHHVSSYFNEPPMLCGMTDHGGDVKYIVVSRSRKSINPLSSFGID